MSNTSNDVRGRETRISYQLIRNVTSPEEKDNGVQTYVANIPATELTKLGTEDNLRTYIPEHSAKRRNAVHKAIERTIVEEPSRFINRNSGVTIACSKANVNDSASMIANDGAHRRAIEPADPSGSHAQARQRIRNVVFPAADPHFQHRRKLNPPMLRRRQSQHALAERNQIEPAAFGIPNLHCESLLGHL